MRKRIFIESVVEFKDRIYNRRTAVEPMMHRPRYRMLILASGIALISVVTYFQTSAQRKLEVQVELPTTDAVDESLRASLQDVEHFAELNFGLPISKFNGLRPIVEKIIPPRGTHSIESIVWFQKPHDLTRIDGAPISKIYYGFRDDQLVEVVVMPSGSDESGRRLLALLERTYPGSRVDHETWSWIGNEAAITYHGFCRLETSMISVIYIFRSDNAFRDDQTLVIHSETDQRRDSYLPDREVR